MPDALSGLPDELPPLRDVIARHEIRATKALGQNFLLDLNLTRKIARAGGPLKGQTVLEIGPGPGGLTRALLAEGADHVVAVERDRRCLAALRELADLVPGRLTLVEADALEIDEYDLDPKPGRIVANLPYNISTPLLFKWLDRLDLFEHMVLMFQKEVVDRLIAKPSTKAYGRLSVITQWLCETKFEFNVDKRAFTPPPKIQSSVLTLRPRTKPLYAAKFEDMEKVTATAFGQRRKMLRSSLKPLDIDISTLGIDPTARAENLTIEEFCLLAKAIEGRD